jgi:hypothetical protein
MYINVATKHYPISEAQLREQFSNTSFPTPFTPPEGYALVQDSIRPEYNPVINNLVEATPEMGSDGTWKQKWSIVPLFYEYIDDTGTLHTAEQQEQEAISAYNSEKLRLLKLSYANIVQNRLDAFAKTRNYDSILSAATYATSIVPKFQQEGQYAVQVRDQTWQKLYELLEEVELGTRPMPSGFQDIEPLLPTLAWPT